MKSILIIADYFGRWPNWFPLFLESCRLNPTIDWLINTDCIVPQNAPKNVRFVSISSHEYNAKVSKALGINFNPNQMYSVCNLRPMFGRIYSAEILGYEYFGWSDVDVVFGDIRDFYTEAVLTNDVITTSAEICSGHFTLFRNTEKMRDIYQIISHWRERLEDPSPCAWSESLDEAKLSQLLSPVQSVRQRLAPDRDVGLVNSGCSGHFVEQWSTPFTPTLWKDGRRLHPEIWYWRNGEITNDRDLGDRFLYLHFMNFRAHRYVDNELYGMAPVWSDIARPAQFHCDNLRERGVRIDRNGIWPRGLLDSDFDEPNQPHLASSPFPQIDGYSTVDLFHQAQALGVEFWLEGAEVRFWDPNLVVPPAARCRLWHTKDILRDLVGGALISRNCNLE